MHERKDGGVTPTVTGHYHSGSPRVKMTEIYNTTDFSNVKLIREYPFYY